MSPFLQFRNWTRNGPLAERALTAAIALLMISVVVWAGAPAVTGSSEQSLDQLGAGTGSGSTSEGQPGTATGSGTVPGTSTGPGTGPGGAAANATAPGAAAGPKVTGPRGTGPTAPIAGGPSADSNCGPMTATDQGVTPKDITVGVVTVDLGALGDLIDLPSTEELQRAYNAAIADVNAKGGVRCRMLKARYYVDSGLDQSQQHAACLQMKEDKVFTVFNNLFSPSESTCVAKQKIPNIWYTAPHTPDVRQYQPYILSWQPDYDQLIRHYVQGAKAEGFFKNMKKLGILERTCYPDEMTALSREMRAAGLDLSKASRFSYGCPEVQPTPEQHTAGVLQFKREGVTHILNIAYADDGEFSRYADQQDYKPAFSHMEDASATAIQTGTQKPGDSFNGTLLISSIETGARETPGYKYNAATQECARIMRKAGLPAPQDQAVAIHFGIACVNVAMFKKMAEAAPSLVRTQLATGLVKSGPLTLSYPAGPVHPTDVGRPTGGQGWRPGKWFTSCQCWRVTNVHYRTDY